MESIALSLPFYIHRLLAQAATGAARAASSRFGTAAGWPQTTRTCVEGPKTAGPLPGGSRLIAGLLLLVVSIAVQSGVAAAGCISIKSPAAGAAVSGSSVAIATTDSCAGLWFETLYVDGSNTASFAPGKVVFNSTAVANGLHTIKVTSQSENPGSIVLGSASETLNVENQAATPTPTATPVSCISIKSPAAGATVSGSSVAIATSDTCAGLWFETLYVDGSNVASFAPGKVVFNSTALANGKHTIKVTSQSSNPGSVTLGAASEPLNVLNGSATPSPSPKPTATPTPISCIGIKNPAAGTIVSGSSIAIGTTDTCSGMWFESLYVDGAHVSDFAAGNVVFNSMGYGNGSHKIQVTSQSKNPGSVMLASAAESLNVQNLLATASATASATATARPSPTPTAKASPTATPKPSATATPPASGTLSIKVSGNRLVDGSGNPVFLHGVNRSGGEYACVSGLGVFSGATDQASVTAMKVWNINSVRLPLNEDCLLGINGMPAQYSGSNYINAVVNYVNLLESNHLYVILDLHWNAPGAYPANSQEAMADSDHAPAFWTAVANAFANDHGVMFDLYNEPYPNGNPVPAWNWSCWANGGCTVSCVHGSCTGVNYTVAGMQQLLNAVRTAEGSGWHHPILMGGMGSASDLTGWLTNHPADPAGQLVANAHAYNDGQSCQDPSTGGCLDTTWKPIISAGYPLTLDEFGQFGCVWDTWLVNMTNWMETRGSSGYTPWGWDAGASCGDPGMITDWSGTANAYGAGYQSHILTLP